MLIFLFFGLSFAKEKEKVKQNYEVCCTETVSSGLPGEVNFVQVTITKCVSGNSFDGQARDNACAAAKKVANSIKNAIIDSSVTIKLE